MFAKPHASTLAKGDFVEAVPQHVCIYIYMS